MEKQNGSSPRKLAIEKELKYFKAVLRSVIMGASKVLGHIELLVHGAEIEEQMSLLDHYLDYTRRLCERDISEASD